MSGFVCQFCGEVHDELPMDVGFQRPDVIWAIPKDDRDEHSACSDDLCMTDDGRFFIRCILEVPVVGMDDVFRWGPWAEISLDDFRHYVEVWDDENSASEPPFPGRLANDLPPLEGCSGLEVTIHPRQADLRPSIVVLAKDHPLAHVQRNGITPQQLNTILRRHGCSPCEHGAGGQRRV